VKLHEPSTVVVIVVVVVADAASTVLDLIAVLDVAGLSLSLQC
jgi:hypothetical protein